MSNANIFKVDLASRVKGSCHNFFFLIIRSCLELKLVLEYRSNLNLILMSMSILERSNPMTCHP